MSSAVEQEERKEQAEEQAQADSVSIFGNLLGLDNFENNKFGLCLAHPLRGMWLESDVSFFAGIFAWAV